MDVDYSIIIPVYFNEGSIRSTFDQILDTVVRPNTNLVGEIIFVDDGSGDNSIGEILALRQLYPELVRVIKFTRNFGQTQAILAGYRHARGRCLVNISADLQDPPELINQMLKAHLEEKFEVVICTREAREEGWFRRITSKLFYVTMRRWSFPEMPPGGFDYMLVGQKVAEILKRNYEANPFLQGQILWTGFPRKFIPYTRMKRTAGRSQWTLGKKVKYLLDGILGYSYLPLRIMSILGLSIALSGFLYAVAIILARIFASVPFKGWAPIMVVVLVLSGFQMLMLGIIGEYLWRTLDQVRQREPYVVERLFE